MCTKARFIDIFTFVIDYLNTKDVNRKYVVCEKFTFVIDYLNTCILFQMHFTANYNIKSVDRLYFSKF